MQAFYAGGSDSSGQQVLGPSRKGKDFVSNIFKSARESGAEVVEHTHTSGPSGSRRYFYFLYKHIQIIKTTKRWQIFNYHNRV